MQQLNWSALLPFLVAPLPSTAPPPSSSLQSSLSGSGFRLLSSISTSSYYDASASSSHLAAATVTAPSLTSDFEDEDDEPLEPRTSTPTQFTSSINMVKTKQPRSLAQFKPLFAELRRLVCLRNHSDLHFAPKRLRRQDLLLETALHTIKKSEEEVAQLMDKTRAFLSGDTSVVESIKIDRLNRERAEQRRLLRKRLHARDETRPASDSDQANLVTISSGRGAGTGTGGTARLCTMRSATDPLAERGYPRPSDCRTDTDHDPLAHDHLQLHRTPHIHVQHRYHHEHQHEEVHEPSLSRSRPTDESRPTCSPILSSTTSLNSPRYHLDTPPLASTSTSTTTTTTAGSVHVSSSSSRLYTNLFGSSEIPAAIFSPSLRLLDANRLFLQSPLLLYYHTASAASASATFDDGVLSDREHTHHMYRRSRRDMHNFSLLSLCDDTTAHSFIEVASQLRNPDCGAVWFEATFSCSDAMATGSAATSISTSAFSSGLTHETHNTNVKVEAASTSSSLFHVRVEGVLYGSYGTGCTDTKAGGETDPYGSYGTGCTDTKAGGETDTFGSVAAACAELETVSMLLLSCAHVDALEMETADSRRAASAIDVPIPTLEKHQSCTESSEPPAPFDHDHDHDHEAAAAAVTTRTHSTVSSTGTADHSVHLLRELSGLLCRGFFGNTVC